MKKSQNCEKSAVADALETEIQHYASQLVPYIDHDALAVAYQIRRRSERLYAYKSILRYACCACFRGTSPAKDGTFCVVWGFNGRYWQVISPNVFRDSVGEALITAAGVGGFIVKGDWVEKEADIMKKGAYGGVCEAILNSSSAIVGFSNGVWDFTDVDAPVYHPFSDRMPVTDLLPYEYDERATCPTWLSFLNMMLRPQDMLKLQKYLGLGVVNRRTMSHVVEDTLWLIGSGANGKSTILNVVRGVYGYDKVSEASMAQLLDRNPDNRMRVINSIDGHVFNICGEMDRNDISRDSDAFKRLSSGEPHDARGIGKDIYVAYNIPFLIFSMNQRPSNRRMDSAFMRRIVEIQFNVSVRPEDMDASLGSKLEKELPGIRNWMIEGYKLLVADDFRFDHTCAEEYRAYNEQFFDIFAEHDGLRATAWAGLGEVPQLVKFDVLREQYRDFCIRKGLVGRDKLRDGSFPSDKALGSDLKRLNFLRVRKASGVYYAFYSDKKIKYAED